MQPVGEDVAVGEGVCVGAPAEALGDGAGDPLGGAQETRRISWLRRSDTKKEVPSFAGPGATAEGKYMYALSAAPSAPQLAVPLPARSEEKALPTSTARRRWEKASATITRRPAASHARPAPQLGAVPKLKAAFVPTPFVNTAVPLPASVLTSPLPSEIARTRLLRVSPTYSVPTPAGSRASPVGLKNAASPPAGASAHAALPLPASVVTAPLTASTTRTRLPARVATYSVAVAARYTMASGNAKAAEVPAPSASPITPLPARVRTALPTGLRLRTRWLLASAINKRFAPPAPGGEPSARAAGPLNCASKPHASANPAFPTEPARVVTTRVALTARIKWLPKSAT